MTIFNAARFIISKIKNKSPIGVFYILYFIVQNIKKFLKIKKISKVYIYIALAKVSKILEAYKTTRICYEKLSVKFFFSFEKLMFFN